MHRLILPRDQLWSQLVNLLPGWHLLPSTQIFLAEYAPVPHIGLADRPDPVLLEALRAGAFIAITPDAPAFRALPLPIPFENSVCVVPDYMPDATARGTLRVHHVTSMTCWLFDRFVPAALFEQPHVAWLHSLLQAVEASMAGYATQQELQTVARLRRISSVEDFQVLVSMFVPPHPFNLANIEGALRNLADAGPSISSAYPPCANYQSVPVVNTADYRQEANVLSCRSYDPLQLLKATENSPDRTGVAFMYCNLACYHENPMTRIYVMVQPIDRATQETLTPHHSLAPAVHIPRVRLKEEEHPQYGAFALACHLRQILHEKGFRVSWYLSGTRYVASFDVLGHLPIISNLFASYDQVLVEPVHTPPAKEEKNLSALAKDASEDKSESGAQSTHPSKPVQIIKLAPVPSPTKDSSGASTKIAETRDPATFPIVGPGILQQTAKCFAHLNAWIQGTEVDAEKKTQ